ncbi:MAG: cadmium-translocating P-type ATPase [Rhodospirillaceae bacterium]|nr:cadmium-translocating P-type ATPase [Rhodospirillaceae bacterium]
MQPPSDNPAPSLVSDLPVGADACCDTLGFGLTVGEAVAAPDFEPGPYVRHSVDGLAELHMIVRNMHCASCVRDIEGALAGVPGVRKARLNAATRRLAIVWEPGRAEARDLITRVTRLGYELTPFDPDKLNENHGDRDLLRAMAVAGFAAANVMLISVAVWSGLAQDMGPATRTLLHWVSALIALPAIAYAGRPFLRSALAALGAGRTNMDVPISLAVVLAAGMSLFEITRGGDHVYFDAAIGLLFFLLIGRYLDRSLRRRVESAAQNLLALQALAATVVTPDGNRVSTPLEEIDIGMTVAVATGERIPVDGALITGISEIDEAMITGESLPRSVGPGDAVHAGTLNLSAPLILRVSAIGADTVLGEIVQLMEIAEQGRARYTRLADRVARWYAPAVHLLAGSAFVWWYWGGHLNWQAALLIAVTVLIVTCPCALGLAVPAVQAGAVGRLLSRGILAKSGDGLERLAEIDTVVFDKTGTLTLGRLELLNGDQVPGDKLRLAAALAASSRHPLAEAVRRAVPAVEVITDVQETPGGGLEAVVDGTRLRLGNAQFVGVEEVIDHGGPELWLRQGDAVPTRILFEDRIREDAQQVVDDLTQQGIAIELLSGDRAPAVAMVARQLGIRIWSSGRKPAEKTRRLADLRSQGHKVLMVGDGLNDAPALAAAHASMSPGTAMDASQMAADFVFQGEHLAPVMDAITLSRRARRLIWQNFALAIGYNLIAVPIAFAGFATPLIAAIAMSGSSLVVTLNALRVRLGIASVGDR